MSQDSWESSLLSGNMIRAEGEEDECGSCPQQIYSLPAISVPYHSSFDNFSDSKVFYYNAVMNTLLKMVFLHQ